MSENTKEQINVIDLLPDNERHLIDIQNQTKAISSNIRKDIHYDGKLSDEKKEEYHDLLMDLLDRVGAYSIPAFEIRDRLEENYVKRFKNDRKEGKRLFLKHYESIHKPYDSQKNSIWKLLEFTFDEK